MVLEIGYFFVVSYLRLAGLSATKTSRWPQGIRSSVMVFELAFVWKHFYRSLLLTDLPVERQHRWLKSTMRWELAAFGFGCNMIRC